MCRDEFEMTAEMCRSHQKGEHPNSISPLKKKKKVSEQAGGGSYVPGVENELLAFKSN